VLQLTRRDDGTAAVIAHRMVDPSHWIGGQMRNDGQTVLEVSSFESVRNWALAKQNGNVTVDELARRSGWSLRRFTSKTGATPP
jgi:hypothetical protein